MKLVPAPARVFKTYAMWLLIATGVFDLAVVLLKTMTELHVIGAETALVINAVMVFLTGVARLIHQQIPTSTEQKIDIVESAASQPMKPGEAPVNVQIQPPST